MQASRSLFQIGIKLKGQPVATGITRSQPFGNAWIIKDQPSLSRPTSHQQRRTMASATTFYDFAPKDSTSPRSPKLPCFPTDPSAEKGAEYPLSQQKGKVVLVVNTASKCGFTPQFAGLEALHKKITTKYPDQFVLLGFPCNQFNSQDPGSNDQIQEFCQLNYGVTFPVLGKTDVNGDKAEPVYEWMKGEKPGLLGLKRIKWNFEKFLIGRDGKVVQRWGSITKPESLESDIVKEIEKKAPVKSEL